jgi:hypothetical protein
MTPPVFRLFLYYRPYENLTTEKYVWHGICYTVTGGVILLEQTVTRCQSIAHLAGESTFVNGDFHRQNGVFPSNPYLTRFSIQAKFEITDMTVKKKIKDLTFDIRCVRNEPIMKMNNISRKRRYRCLS